MEKPYKIGIDVGGTKIAAILLDCDDQVVFEYRIASPRDDYDKTTKCITEIVEEFESYTSKPSTVGIGIPGSVSPASGLVQNSNSTWINGKPLLQDLTSALGREIRIENDANCFALSEAMTGAAKGMRSVFGVILGTGCGGGLVCDGKLLTGPHAIGGEWGHNPLPWPTHPELGVLECWCGKMDCLESWISGTGVSADHFRVNNAHLDTIEIARAARAGDAKATDTLNRFLSRLARGLAAVTNILDPEVIVIGGGLSNIDMMYDALPQLMQPYIFADHFKPQILKPHHGDASGVRGAAHLWP